MRNQNITLNIATLPIWWYTTGLSLVWQWFQHSMQASMHNTGIKLFARHLKEPLYGDYTRSGIFISFFLRLVLLGFMILWVGIRIGLAFLGVVLFALIIPIAIIMIIYNLIPM